MPTITTTPFPSESYRPTRVPHSPSLLRIQSTRRGGGCIRDFQQRPIRKNRMPQDGEDMVVTLMIEQPAREQVRAANELRKRALPVSPTSVRCIWLWMNGRQCTGG